MQHSFESWTIEQFIARRMLKRRMAWRMGFVLAVCASQIGVASWAIYSRHEREQKRYHDKPCEDQGVTDAGTTHALTQAIGAWEKALGHHIRRPNIFRNTCDQPCPGAIACSDPDKYWIYVVSMGNADIKTILMHEIGHLLHVPHIDGDPLMDGNYKAQGLTAPTPAAIALAKLAEGVKP